MSFLKHIMLEVSGRLLIRFARKVNDGQRRRAAAIKVIFAFALILAATASVKATTVVRMTFDEQAVAADLIIMGRAVKSEPVKWHGYPCTKISIHVEEVIAGKAVGDVVTIIQPGTGKFVVAGVKKLHRGKPYLLFMEKLPGGDYRIVGFNQGMHRVIVEKTTSRKIVMMKTNGHKSRGLTLDAARKRIRAVRKSAEKSKGPK